MSEAKRSKASDHIKIKELNDIKNGAINRGHASESRDPLKNEKTTKQIKRTRVRRVCMTRQLSLYKEKLETKEKHDAESAR